MCGYKKQKEIPRKAFLLISVSLCLANARALELLSFRTPGILDGVYFLYRAAEKDIMVGNLEPVQVVILSLS